MDNWITALVALGLMAAFLLRLALSIGSIPFFLIMAVVLAFALADFHRSMRGNSNGGSA
jgi:hypothetical protein